MNFVAATIQLIREDLKSFISRRVLKLYIYNKGELVYKVLKGREAINWLDKTRSIKSLFWSNHIT